VQSAEVDLCARYEMWRRRIRQAVATCCTGADRKRTVDDETVSHKLGRLRLEAARRQHNLQTRASKATGHALPSRIRSNAPSDLGDSGTSGPSPPSSWRPLFTPETKQRAHAAALALPASDLKDPLIRHRHHTLNTLESSPADTRFNLLYSCLAWFVLDLASEEPASLDLIATLPLHLKCKLASLASTLAPLSDAAIQELFIPPAAEAAEQDSWEAATADDEDALEDLQLGFSAVTSTTLQRILFTPEARPRLHYPFLSRICLSASVNLQLSNALVQSLASLPSLQHLQLAQMSVPASLEPAHLLAKLATATPRLATVDLSYNSWLTWAGSRDAGTDICAS
jgi:hypothetical protein